MPTTTASALLNPQVVQTESCPEPSTSIPAMSASLIKDATHQVLDPKDPEGFLRRCSGHNKKKGTRCSAIIGRNSQQAKDSNSTYLPTCHTHKDQKSYAGRCQFTHPDGEKCGILFRWTPPQFELCTQHQGQSDRPCYLMSLPLELRLEIFRYLIPKRAIGSSTSLLHVVEEEEEPPGWFCLYTPSAPVSSSTTRPGMIRKSGQVSPIERSTLATVFPIPLLDVLLVNRQIHAEVKDLLYSSVPFTVDVRKDGTYMCGRRLLEPRRADGSSHFVANEVDNLKNKFLNTFDWASVKNYNVDILVEKWEDTQVVSRAPGFWDEEVEIYDIRDYVGVVVSGILAKSRNLCKLNVRIGLSRFSWSDDELIKNIKTIVGPFERLRNVRQPRLRGIYDSTPHTNFMISLPLPAQARAARAGPEVHAKLPTPLCSVPQLPAQAPLQICTQPSFASYRSDWERCISSTAPSSVVHKPPIRTMFTQFKEFYSKLCCIVPAVMQRSGRHAFLHKARVAREQEDVEAFRQLRNELIEYWYCYWENEERKKADIERRLDKMLNVDIYPTVMSEPEVAMPKSTSQSPLLPNMEHPVPATVPSSLFSQNGKYSGMPQQFSVPSATTSAASSRKSSASDPSASSPALQQYQIQQTMALNPRPPLPNDPLSQHYAQLQFLEEQSRRALCHLRQQHQHYAYARSVSHLVRPALLSPQHHFTGSYPVAPMSTSYTGRSTNISRSSSSSSSSSSFSSSSAQQSPSTLPSPVSSHSSSPPHTALNLEASNPSGYGSTTFPTARPNPHAASSTSLRAANDAQQARVPKRAHPSSAMTLAHDGIILISDDEDEPSPHQNKRPRRQDRTDSALGLGISRVVDREVDTKPRDVDVGADTVLDTNASTDTDAMVAVGGVGPAGSYYEAAGSVEKVEPPEKRERWVGDGGKEVNENGDEVVRARDEADVFRLWEQEGAKRWKGKGKAVLAA